MRTGKLGRAFRYGELHPDRIALVVMILDLGFGERRTLDNRPHHWLGTAIELARHGEFQQLTGDARFRMEIHRQVGVLEVSLDAETTELFRLHADPVLRELAAFLAEFVDRHL